jgi:glycosyltransferase involved in cell wall biosynthesis
VLSTAFDVLAGRRALIRAARQQGPPAIVHVRSYVPALIALSARPNATGRLLFDIRGFWADERVEGGIWPEGGLLYRVAKRCERRFFAEADAIVTLTDASVPQIRAWTGGRPVGIDVIPTCVALERFIGRPERPGGPHVVWSGSIGTWYRFDLSAKVARELALPLSVITRQAEQARAELHGYPASVRAVAPEEMPAQLFAGDIGLCLIKSSFSKTASAPTRFAEYLAAGMPTIVSPGVGDLEAIVTEHRVGVVLRGEDTRAIAAAAADISAVAADPGVRERCRSLARERYDVDAGSAQYASIYARLSGGGR